MGIFDNIVRVFRQNELAFKHLIGLPLVGEINDRFVVEPPRLSDFRFGKTTKLPTILEIYISDFHQWPLDIGRKVKSIYFADYPPIVFNVCFSCAHPSLFGRGDYANPLSHWFNVFFGFYEIDVPKSRWTRPFGFQNAKTGDDGFEPNFDDLLRIAKSDWNYFSNNIYGVPDADCARHDGVSMDGIETKVLNPRVMIGERRFVECRMDHAKVVSGYVSGRDGKKLLNNDGLFSPIWRTVFGRPKAAAEFPQSFIPTDMRMQVVMTFYEEYDEDLEETAFKTLIGGGAIHLGYPGPIDNNAFLRAQLDAVIRSLSAKPFQKKKMGRPCALWRKSGFRTGLTPG